MNNINCIIIHGCPSSKEKAMNPETRTYDKHWIPWLKKQLIANGIKTETPLMPTPWQPDYSKWKNKFEKLNINKNTILIGHSGGCAFLVRWLGEAKQKIKKLILVAPWKIPSEDFSDEENELYDFKINKNIKNNIENIIIFTSNNEEGEGKESLKIFHNALGGEVINLKNHGHYCLENMGTEEFPELLQAVLK